MKLKFFVLLFYLLSNSKNEITAKSDNKKVVTKYIYHAYNYYGDVTTFKRNKFDEKISKLGVIFYK